MSDQAKPSKPKPRRIPSDDFAVAVGGETFYPHKGESLWIVGSPTIGELKATWAFNQVSVRLDDATPDPAAEGEDEAIVAERFHQARVASMRIIEEHYDDLLRWVAPRLADWNWTDDEGQPMPKPDRTPAPLMALSQDELFYVRSVLRGEGPADEGNDASSSATTSSATA